MFGASPGKITHSPAPPRTLSAQHSSLQPRGSRAAQQAAEADGRGLQPHEQPRSTPTW